MLNIPIKFYNTKGRKIEEFKPLIPGVVRYYSCGPTVYSFIHVGNLFASHFSDLLRRLFSFWGYEVRQVVNITDVGHLTHDADMGEEDRILKAVKEWKKQKGSKVTVQDVVDFYTAFYIKSFRLVNIKVPVYFTYASHHVKEMQDIISVLLKKGYAYKTKSAVYYDVLKFKDYNKLSPQALKEKQVGTRKEVKVDPTKKHPADFRLWQLDQPNHILKWKTPWGCGFPGWHIECSAMSMKYLGHTLDIHTGGIEHIPVHHTNEIAQSEAATGKEYANFWLHNQHVVINNKKMAKSEGNGYTLIDIIKWGYKPWHIRLFYNMSHYRSVINFSKQRLETAKDLYEKIQEYFQIAKWQFIIFAKKNNKLEFAKKALNSIFVEQQDWEQELDLLKNVDKINIPKLLSLAKNREVGYRNIFKKGYSGIKPRFRDKHILTYSEIVNVLNKAVDEDIVESKIAEEFIKELRQVLELYANDLASPVLVSKILEYLKKYYIKAPFISLLWIAVFTYLTGVALVPFILPPDLLLKNKNAKSFQEILNKTLELVDLRLNKQYKEADKIKAELLKYKNIKKIVDIPNLSIIIMQYA